MRFNGRSNADKFVVDYGSVIHEAKTKVAEGEPEPEPSKAKRKATEDLKNVQTKLKMMTKYINIYIYI